MVLLLACWRPDPYVPPEPPEAAITALEARPEPENAAGEAPSEGTPEDAPEGTPEVVGEGEGIENPEAGIEATPTPVPIDPYKARLGSAPAMLVDDLGQPVMALDKPNMELEVRADEGYRKRVVCLSCVPQAEGWLQDKLVVRQQ